MKRKKLMLSMLCGILGYLCFGGGDWLMLYGKPSHSGRPENSSQSHLGRCVLYPQTAEMRKRLLRSRKKEARYMGILKTFFNNTGKPTGFLGKLMVNGMNSGHSAMASWGFSCWETLTAGDVLDIGCGGGANLAEWLRRIKSGTVTGVDYSEVSVEKSQKVNAAEIASGRCRVVQGNVRYLPFADNSFDCISAFETIYFWPGIQKSFQEVYRVLKTGGSFLICNESDGTDPSAEKWTRMIDGMKIYREAEIRTLLEKSGFSHIQAYRNEKRGWISFSAMKQ